MKSSNLRLDQSRNLRFDLRCLAGLTARDLIVLRRGWSEFLSRSIAQPILVLFVFAYVLPRSGAEQGVLVNYTETIVPGLGVFGGLFAAVYAVGMPMAVDFSSAREIDDRARAPVPLTAFFLQRVGIGAVQGTLAATAVMAVALLEPNFRDRADVNWPLAVVSLLLIGWFSSALGLAIGSWVRPAKLASVFSTVILPAMFLGCAYFRWSALDEVRWLQVMVLANPVTYLCEALRAATTSVPTLSTAIALGASVAFSAAITVFGGMKFHRRLAGS